MRIRTRFGTRSRPRGHRWVAPFWLACPSAREARQHLRVDDERPLALARFSRLWGACKSRRKPRRSLRHGSRILPRGARRSAGDRCVGVCRPRRGGRCDPRPRGGDALPPGRTALKAATRSPPLLRDPLSGQGGDVKHFARAAYFALSPSCQEPECLATTTVRYEPTDNSDPTPKRCSEARTGGRARRHGCRGVLVIASPSARVARRRNRRRPRAPRRASPTPARLPRTGARVSPNASRRDGRGSPPANLFHRRSTNAESVSSSDDRRPTHSARPAARPFPPLNLFHRRPANAERLPSNAERRSTRPEGRGARGSETSNRLHRRARNTERRAPCSERRGARGSQPSNLLHRCPSKTERVPWKAAVGARHSGTSKGLFVRVSRRALRRARRFERHSTTVLTGASQSDTPPAVTARARTDTTVPGTSPWSSTSARTVSGTSVHAPPSFRICHSYRNPSTRDVVAAA